MPWHPDPPDGHRFYGMMDSRSSDEVRVTPETYKSPDDRLAPSDPTVGEPKAAAGAVSRPVPVHQAASPTLELLSHRRRGWFHRLVIWLGDLPTWDRRPW